MNARHACRAACCLLGLFVATVSTTCTSGHPAVSRPPDSAGAGAGGGSAGAAGDQGSSGAAGATPRGQLGRDCDSAEPVLIPAEPASAVFFLRGTTEDADDDVRGGAQGCAGLGAGPDRFYLLDLSQRQGPTWVTLMLDATADMLIRLERGSCVDRTGVLCVHDGLSGDLVKGKLLSARLGPGQYFVSVDGVSSADVGEYALQVLVESEESDCEARHNTSCESAQLIPTQFATQSVIVPGCDDAEPDPLYYELDLSQRSGTVAVRIGLERLDRYSNEVLDTYPWPELSVLDGTGACGTLLDPPRFWLYDSGLIHARLEPGRYLLANDTPLPLPSLLTVQVTPLGCAEPPHDTCQDAEVLDLSGGFVEVSGDTYCNTDRLYHDACSDEHAPDRFYRVDLSERTGRTRLRAQLTTQGLDFYAQLVLFQEERGDCGVALHCFDPLGNAEGWPRFEAIVDPGVYLLAVDGVEKDAVGHYTLQVDVSDAEKRDYRACFDLPVDECLSYFNDAAYDTCCENPLLPQCGTMFISCGLDPQVQDCVCETDPVCCNGTEDDFQRCASVFAACNFFCPSDEPSLLDCVDQEGLRGG